MSFTYVTLLLLDGFKLTFLLFLLTLVFSLPLGLVVALGAMSKFKPLKGAVRIFVWIIRGTPLMLQLFVVFYVPNMLFGTRVFNGDDGRFLAALIAFVINYACYFSEIYRGGIESVSKGQYEAGAVLGMTKTQIFFKVCLLQAVKRILPPMSNEIITLVKDTSLARVIAVAEIFFVNEVKIMSHGIIWQLAEIGVVYLIFIGLLTLLFNKAEKKLAYFKV